MVRSYETNAQRRNRHSINLTAADNERVKEVLVAFAAKFKGVTPSISLLMQVALDKLLDEVGTEGLSQLHKELVAKAATPTKLTFSPENKAALRTALRNADAAAEKK